MTPPTHGDLASFLEEAFRRGLYTDVQRRLMSTALKQLTGGVPTNIARLEHLLGAPDAFGDVSDSSRASYRARIKRLLRDFRRWDGRAETWALERLAAPRQVELPLRREVSVPLRIGGQRHAEVRYPSDLSEQEMHAFIAGLDSFRAFLVSQLSKPAPEET